MVPSMDFQSFGQQSDALTLVDLATMKLWQDPRRASTCFIRLRMLHKLHRVTLMSLSRVSAVSENFRGPASGCSASPGTES